jgi:hypothetical protein
VFVLPGSFITFDEKYSSFASQVTAAGKTVLITDCTSKIGYALARQLDDMVSLKLKYKLYYSRNKLFTVSCDMDNPPFHC